MGQAEPQIKYNEIKCNMVASFQFQDQNLDHFFRRSVRTCSIYVYISGNCFYYPCALFSVAAISVNV